MPYTLSHLPSWFTLVVVVVVIIIIIIIKIYLSYQGDAEVWVEEKLAGPKASFRTN